MTEKRNRKNIIRSGSDYTLCPESTRWLPACIYMDHVYRHFIKFTTASLGTSSPPPITFPLVSVQTPVSSPIFLLFSLCFPSFSISR